MHVATIVRDKAGRHHVRLGKKAQAGGEVEVIETLNGSDIKELKRRAERFIQELEEKQ